MPQKKHVIRFELRNLEKGYWVELEVDYSKKNWDWVTNHPDTGFIRKTTPSVKPVVTFNA